MEKMDYWRLCDELSVVQAALLIIGEDAAACSNVMNWGEDKWPENFAAALAALSHASSRRPASVNDWMKNLRNRRNSKIAHWDTKGSAPRTT